MGLTLLAEWAKLAEEKGKLQNLVERNGLGAQLEEAKMDEIRTAREVAETAKEYGEQNETLRGEVQNLLKKSAFSASVMMNFLATESVDLDGPDSPGVDEVSPVNYQGESIELTPRQQRVTNAMLKQVTTAQVCGQVQGESPADLLALPAHHHCPPFNPGRNDAPGTVTSGTALCRSTASSTQAPEGRCQVLRTCGKCNQVTGVHSQLPGLSGDQSLELFF